MTDESILNSVKAFIGIDESDKAFDEELMMGINTQLRILNQLGIGSDISVSDETDLWSEFIAEQSNMDGVKSYVSIRTKLLFDPPANNALLTSYQEIASELEWRLNAEVDFKDGDDNG